MFSQVVRNPRHLAPCRSSLRQHLLLPVRLASTSAESTSNSTDSAPPPISAENTKKAKEIHPVKRRTAYIRTWEPVRNVADAWAIIRVLERKYGKIITAHFLKDFENPSKYQLMSWVIFEDPESLARIPKSGFNFSIPSPGIDKPAHEISMEDVEDLAVTAKYEPGYEIPIPEPGTEKVIGVKITPSDFEYNGTSFANRIYQNSNFRTMEAFVGWAGFSPLKPIPPRNIKEHELFSNKTDDEQIRMRAALEIASRYTSVYNPGIISPANTEKLSEAVVEEQKKERKIEKTAEASRVGSESLETASTMTTTETSAELPTPSSSSPTEPATIEQPPQSQSGPTHTPLTPQHLEAKRVAKEQMDLALDLARQLAARTASERERRKQPKPVVKSAKPKKSKKAGAGGPPQGGYFYDFEAKPQKNLTVMDRLRGLFGR